MTKTRAKAKIRPKASNPKLNQRGLLRLNKRLLAFVALFAILGAGFYIAVGNGTIRLATNEHTASAANTWSLCSKRYGGCIINHGNGNQVTVSTTTNNTYRRIHGLGCEQQDAASCAEYQDVQTGRCLKADPNVAGVPVVEWVCATSGTTMLQEEWSFIGGTLGNAATWGDYATADAVDLNGAGKVLLGQTSDNGSLWVQVLDN